MSKDAVKLIIDARKAKGWTQEYTAEKLAEALKQTYSSRQYQRLEEGSFPKFKREVIENLDKILGTNVYDIIYDKNVPHETPLPIPEIDFIKSTIDRMLTDREKALAVIEKWTNYLLDNKSTGSEHIQLAPPGTEGTETRNPRKEKKPIQE